MKETLGKLHLVISITAYPFDKPGFSYNGLVNHELAKKILEQSATFTRDLAIIPPSSDCLEPEIS